MVLDGGALDQQLHGRPSDPCSYLRRFGYDVPEPGDVADVAELDAEINHAVWIWRCPCGLGSADDPPLGGGVAFVPTPIGWCVRCENVSAGGLWRRLRFPRARAAIEAILALRPDPTTRNWRPGETVDDLLAENRAHGVAS